ncbi:hypothetical protein GCM10009738_75860 [Kitasatospora viridis]
MSRYPTSSPVRSFTRWFRTRSDVPRCNCRKCTPWSSVAENNPTGTATSPKLNVPVQIGLAIAAPPLHTPSPHGAPRQAARARRPAIQT